MKEISLTQGFVAQVDDEDYDYLSQFKWCYDSNGYAVRDTSTGKHVRMQNDIMRPADNMIVDHRNHKTLNNQRFNLRVCTRAQNSQNSKRSVGSSHNT